MQRVDFIQRIDNAFRTHSNELNLAELARSFACSESTIRRYIDLLTGTFMLRQLPPFIIPQ